MKPNSRSPLSNPLSAALSAALLTLAFAPYPCVFFLGVALVPLIWVLFEASPKAAWKNGYLFGLIFSIGQLHWLYQLAVKWTGSIVLALIPWLLASVLMALYFGLIVWLWQRCIAAKQFWMIPMVWAGVEVFRSYIPVVAFPWGLLASPLSSVPALIQPAHFGTIFLISAWVVTVNLGLVLLLRRVSLKDRQAMTSRVQPALILATAVFLPLASVITFVLPRPTQPLRVTIGQTGLDMAFEADPARTDQKIGKIVRKFIPVADGQHSRVLVLPEGIAHGKGDRSFFPFPLNPKVPMVFGAQREGPRGRMYQSAIGFDGQWHYADKTRLVIFGEFVPARDYLPVPAEFRLPSGDLSAGEGGVRSMTVGGIVVGPLLCFEGLFPDLAYRQSANGASFLAVMSIDDWFMNSSAPEQLRGASIWRAVETGLPVARAASLGYSLACDGQGRLIAQAPVQKSIAFAANLPVPTTPPMSAELPVFPVFAFVLTIALSLGSFVKRPKLPAA